MKKIFLLDDLTINKIAAGEVVERPASVIKELVENSIDASSKRITIEISDGGKELISISDDGDGIDPEDIPLAFERHSTSKLRQIEDIQLLYTNGFRGEALSSIAAVSKIEMMTNVDDSGLGKRVVVQDGKIQSIQDAGMKKGTIIRVKDLFYNIPARKKFLKSNTTETSQINEILSKLAIANSDIAMKYISNGREVFGTVGDGEMLNAISAIYGRSISSGLIPIRYQSNQLSIEGYVSKSNLYQSNRKKEHIFFNKRSVRNSPLAYVVENIYKDLIPIGKYPVFFINISIDPMHIDPNVHPSKLEIKISSDVDIAQPLSECIREALFQSSRNLIPQAQVKSSFAYHHEKSSEMERDSLSRDFAAPQNDSSQSYSSLSNPFYRGALQDDSSANPFFYEKSDIVHPTHPKVYESESNYGKSSFEYTEFVMKENEEANQEVIHHEDREISSNLEQYFPSSKLVVKEEQIGYSQESIMESSTEIIDYTKLNVVGVVMSTYIVVTLGESMFLIDQHAAHERIQYEKFLRQLNLDADDQQFASQELLVAELREFSSFEHDILLENSAIFHRLGYAIEDFGFNRIAIRSYPIFFEKVQGLEFFTQIADLLFEEKNVSLNEYFNDKIAKMACKSSVKANQTIQEQEITRLFERLNECTNKYTCPHGRPIFVEWKKREIEKMFKRIV